MALEVIHRLDIAQESRQLSSAEFQLRQGLKRRVIGYSVIERARKKQISRVKNMREGNANTKYFHLKVNGRRRRTHINRFQDALSVCYVKPITANGAGASSNHHTFLGPVD